MVKLLNLPKQPSTEKEIQTAVHNTIKYFSAFQKEDIFVIAILWIELKYIKVSEKYEHYNK